MGASRQWVSRAIAVLVIASVGVVWAATAAHAKQINSVSQLKASCAKGNGKFTQVGKGAKASAICDVQGGTVTCSNTPPKGQPKCSGTHDSDFARFVPTGSVKGANGVVMTTQEVSDSHVWTQNVGVADLGGGVCANLGGKFLSSADGALGTCTTPTATLLCRATGAGSSCVGIADTSKHADTISKRAKAAAGGTTGSTAPSSTTPATTATTAPTSSTSGSAGTGAPQRTVPVQPPK